MTAPDIESRILDAANALYAVAVEVMGDAAHAHVALTAALARAAADMLGPAPEPGLLDQLVAVTQAGLADNLAEILTDRAGRRAANLN